MSFGTDIYGSPFGAPDVEPIDAIAYAQGVVLYVADDFVEDGYIIEPIPVTASAPAVSAFQVVAGNASASIPQVTASAPEPTLTISQIRVDVDFPAITATAPAVNAGAIRNVIAFTKGIELYVADDFVEDGYAQEPIDVTISVPQVTTTTSVDAAAQAAMVTVSLTAAEASATGSATATFGALLVSATAPQGSGVADGSVTVSVASGSLVISSPDPSVSANSSITSTSNTVSITSPDATATGGGTGSATIPEIFVIKPSVYEYATEFPNAIPSVVISAAVATPSAGSSTSVSADTVTSSAPQASVSVNNSVDVTSNTINVSAPVISVTGGTGATATTQGEIEYVADDYVEDGYVLEFQLVEISAPEPTVTIVIDASASASVGTINITPPVSSASGGVLISATSNTILASSPQVTLGVDSTINVSSTTVTISAPAVAETVIEFPENLPVINVSAPQSTVTGTANIDVIPPQIQVTAPQVTATGTANISVSAVTVQVQPPQVFETVREFPRTLPVVQVSAPVVVGTGTANVDVDHASVTVTAPSIVADTGGDASSDLNVTIIVTTPTGQAVNSSAPSIVDTPFISVSAPEAEATGIEFTNALAEVSVGTITVSSATVVASVFVTDPERTIIVASEVRVIEVQADDSAAVDAEDREIMVQYENRTIVVT